MAMLNLGIEVEDIGRKNEHRLHVLAERLVYLLALDFEDIVCASCRRSEHDDPQDRHGEDVSICLVIESRDGQKKRGRVVYDSKSSSGGIQRYYRKKNRHMHGPGQKDCLLKKAILVNEDRTDDEITEELINDLIKVGLLSPSTIKWYRERMAEAVV
jgi:hypothetical protein